MSFIVASGRLRSGGTSATMPARGASVAVDINRRLVYKSLTSTLDEMLDYDAIAATLTAMTEDAKEGTTSFMEKRDPQFKGF